MTSVNKTVGSRYFHQTTHALPRSEDRTRVLAFAEMLYNMQRAKKWAKREE